MATAKLTLLGIESDLNYYGKSLFDSLKLPDGFEKDDIVNQILLDCGEFEVLYPSADFLTEAIGLWGKRWYRTFDKWLTALNIEYAPLENYDRTEERSNEYSNKGSNSSSSDITGVDKVSAFDSSDFVNRNMSETNSNNSGNTSDTGSNTEKVRAHGNIGVTTSQQMLEAELKLAGWNLTKQIVDVFKQEFCIMVYS